MQSLQGIGNLNVVRSKDCGGYKWRVKWVDGGDKLPISVKKNNLKFNPLLKLKVRFRYAFEIFSIILIESK